MLILIVVLGVLLLLILVGILAHSSTRLSFLEKDAEIIDFIEVRDTSEYPHTLDGYQPVVRFEVGGKYYQGTADVFPLWKTKTEKSLTIFYNPENPAEFKVKQSSNSPATGCVAAIVITVALAISIFFFLRHR